MAGANENAKSLMDAIYKRHAVRAYRPDKIDSEAIRTPLHAAVRAPTAIHLEPWAFVVIQNRSLLKRLSDRAKDMASWEAESAPTAAQAHRDHPNPLADSSFNIFYDAGTLIVICAKPTGLSRLPRRTTFDLGTEERHDFVMLPIGIAPALDPIPQA